MLRVLTDTARWSRAGADPPDQRAPGPVKGRISFSRRPESRCDTKTDEPS